MVRLEFGRRDGIHVRPEDLAKPIYIAMIKEYGDGVVRSQSDVFTRNFFYNVSVMTGIDFDYLPLVSDAVWRMVVKHQIHTVNKEDGIYV